MPKKYDAAALLNFDREAMSCLRPQQVRRGAVTPEVLLHFLRLAQAYWRHDGDIAKPHAELTSGQCSDGFVDVLRLLTYPNICQLLARELVRKLHGVPGAKECIGWVIGSDHAGATISFAVACELGVRHDFTEKADQKDRKVQLWKRHLIKDDQAILQVEELITTSATLQAVRRGIENGNDFQVEFADVILTVVNRSGQSHYLGAEIISLLDLDIKVWSPKKCPLCAKGSPRIKPKMNWEELTS